MCRLYGFRATEATKVECTLVHAQNALIVQSRGDREGLQHGHGWGVATYEDGGPHIQREAWAAYQGEHFQRAAARVFSRTVIAHVRRATIGEPKQQNTHPFGAGAWAFAHNGTVPRFERVRERMLGAMSPEHRAAIEGETDSEHVFRMLMTRIDRDSHRPLSAVFGEVVNELVRWCTELAPGEPIGLNLLLTDGERMVGSRIGRTLYHVEREAIRDCEVCGFPHVHHSPGQPYFAVVIASEPISNEAWIEVPEGSIYEVTPDLRLHVEALASASTVGG